MDDYIKTLHYAIEAAACGDIEAFHIARWLLWGLRDPPPAYQRSKAVR